MTESEIRAWLDHAYQLAEQAEREDEVPVGAVVVYQGKIVGTGYNRREQDQSPIAHAEILAIQDAAKKLGSWRLLDCDLFVTLEPCPMCLSAIQQGRLRHVYFGTLDPKGGSLSLGYKLHEDARTNHRFQVAHFDHAPSREVLKRFFKKKRAE